MLKNFFLSVVALVVLTAGAMADDFSDVAGLSAASISDAAISIDDGSGLNVDVDGLASAATGEKSDAVEACFRSFGYNRCGYNYGCYNYGYNYGCYNYNYCYQPSYFCYRPVTYYTTCYTPCYTPCYSYWGCY